MVGSIETRIIRRVLDTSAATGEAERYECADGTVWKREPFGIPDDRPTGVVYGRIVDDRIERERQ